ncbi:hypothetical protein EG328_011199 [Venturia inaequalis]|uniref:Major facilitator superfamily (MFS) profile domain-containing protein n=1 Tax=Venturia inaequalis TaxID=5025 RepID=A0A8H3V4Q8_VENIN|nr:hypothetical protein EG328_011199 [Venturia inaequalis]KAE9983262.1 hypothetical protein EG327_005564 [Venturia inaequalis]
MEMNYNDRELHRIEQELHVEILPGTEIMTDLDSHHLLKGGETVLVPQPTDDPNDPLNWSLSWKISAIVASSMVTFSQGFGPLALAPMFGDYIKAFNCTLAEAVQFTGVCILILGFSNFIWVPISTSFGRRPVLLFSSVLSMGSCIWRARAQTYGSFMGACVLHGIGSGPAETMQPAVIADIFFLHDRGKWNTLYWVLYMGSLMVGPIISGSMALHVGWRSFWWLNVGLLGLTSLMVAFMFPETKFHRPHPSELNKPAPVDSKEKFSTGDCEKAGDDAATIENTTIEEVTTANSTAPKDNGLVTAETTARDSYVCKGRPKKSQWALFQPNAHPFESILLDLWTPWKLFAFPIVEFASFVVSWSCSSFLTINLTQTQAFAAPPYNFSSQTVGFTNFAILIGAFIGLATAGPLSDWVSTRATKKNGGVREPEMRLPALIPYVLIMLLGNIVFSVGYQKHWPWEVIVVIGFACVGIQVAALPAIVSTYAVDSYKPVAGSLFVSITVNKNVWGYGIGKFITPWAEKKGFIAPIMTNTALVTLWCLFGILFYYKGKTFRRWSKNSKVHQM